MQLRSFITLDLLPLWKEAWFYPELGRVRGWQGTQDIMFVALNPSYGSRFPSPADHFFYRELDSHSLGNAHLTDAVKSRERKKDMPEVKGDTSYMSRQRLYLQWEMDILQPRLIVAVGEDALKILNGWFPADNRVRLEPLPHYAWAQRYGHQDVFRRELCKLRQEYDGILVPASATRYRFWSTLLERATGKTPRFHSVQPSKKGYIVAPTGKGGLIWAYVIRRHDANVELFIARGKDRAAENKAIFDALHTSRQSIEAKFGAPLEWQRLDAKKACRIKKDIELGGYLDEARWPEIQEAMIDAMTRLDEGLGPHL